MTQGMLVIEINMIAGMGHGTPLDDHLGTPGPYMLDVGISSTREIARFWGIAAIDESTSTMSRHQVPAGHPPLLHSRELDIDKATTKSLKPIDVAATPRQTASGSTGAKKIIEDALRAAGLMR